MPSFKHSGDLGDIVYALPFVKHMGGGILYLDANGGRGDPLMRQYAFEGHTNLNPLSVATIRPLLLAQSYIDDVKMWQGEPVDFNLDRFRTVFEPKINIVLFYFRAFSREDKASLEPWLDAPQALGARSRTVLINRTVRYQAKYHWWLINLPKFADRCQFIGLKQEHEIFEYTFGRKIPYRPTSDASEIATALLESETLVGNQSFVMSIAAGLGSPYFQEVYDSVPDCIFERPNAKYF